MAENPKMKKRRKIGQVDSEESVRQTEVKVEMGRVKIDHSGGGMRGNVMIQRGGSSRGEDFWLVLCLLQTKCNNDDLNSRFSTNISLYMISRRCKR